MEKLIAAIESKTTKQILECVRMVGGATQEQRMVRAALIEVYGKRCGDEAADALMDELGL